MFNFRLGLFWEIADRFYIYWIEKSLTLYRRHNFNNSWNIIKLWEDIYLWISYFIEKFNLYKSREIEYKLYHLKTYVNYLKWNRLNTIKYWLKSFKYSFTKNFKERIWMILLSLLPQKLNNYLYNKLRR